MDENHSQADDNPITAADQTENISTEQAPSEAVAQGSNSSEVVSEVTSEQASGTPVDTAAEEFAAVEATPPTPTTAAASSEPEMTMEEALAGEGEEHLKQRPIHRGMTTKGTIIMLGQQGIIVDVGAKIEGTIPYNQLFEQEVSQEDAAKYFKSGDEVQVYVVRSDIPNNTIILSKKRADQERAWGLLQHIYDEEKPVEVEIIERVRGGLVANLGVRAFLPASQVDVRRVVDLDPYVGKRVKVRIIELNRKRNRIIISRRSIVEEDVAEVKAETLKKLEPGAILEGEVVEITDFGAFVNLGGVDGLVHRSEIGYQRFNHPKEVLELGQVVKAEVLNMDIENERINLSMKKLVSDPWENVLSTYVIGEKVSGRVTNLTPFGAFIELEPGLEGLIHVSEMSWTKRVRHPKEVLEVGDEVEAMVLKIDLEDKRVSLGLRQTKPDPWSSLPDRYPVGTEVSGKITGLTDFGVFIEIEEGIEGLIHVSELSHERVENIADEFKKGDEIDAVVLNIDPVEQRASLSRKRTLPYVPPAVEDRPANQYSGGGGGKKGKGRRGGRRGGGIDYDYSYAAAESGSKSTKLGDVYADLFAQFGLSDQPAEEAPEAEAKTEAAAPEAVVETPAPEATAEASAPEAVAEAAPEPTPATKVEAKEEEPVDPANAVDAAEAAALLTAAFREGKKPAEEAGEGGATTEEGSDESA